MLVNWVSHKGTKYHKESLWYFVPLCETKPTNM